MRGSTFRVVRASAIGRDRIENRRGKRSRGAKCLVASSPHGGRSEDPQRAGIRRSAKLGSIVGAQGARYAGTKAANVARSDEAGQREARGAPPGNGDEDGRRARPDEGRGDEARPVRLVHRHRIHPRGVPRDLPGAARQAAQRGARDALGAGRQSARRGVRRRTALRVLRRDRARGVRRRLDRPGPPGRAARRAPGRGEDPVPGDRRGDGGRPAERRDDRAAGARRSRRASTRRRSPRRSASG